MSRGLTVPCNLPISDSSFSLSAAPRLEGPARLDATNQNKSFIHSILRKAMGFVFDKICDKHECFTYSFCSSVKIFYFLYQFF